jgi:hypothetical protein
MIGLACDLAGCASIAASADAMVARLAQACVLYRARCEKRGKMRRCVSVDTHGCRPTRESETWGRCGLLVILMGRSVALAQVICLLTGGEGIVDQDDGVRDSGPCATLCWLCSALSSARTTACSAAPPYRSSQSWEPLVLTAHEHFHRSVQ